MPRPKKKVSEPAYQPDLLSHTVNESNAEYNVAGIDQGDKIDQTNVGKSGKGKNNGGRLGFEEKLWLSADKLRGHMDASEYKHVVLGLVFLKYLSDAFSEQYLFLQSIDKNPEDKENYIKENKPWLPQSARWEYIGGYADSVNIGDVIDAAMITIEKENPSLHRLLPKDYKRPSLSHSVLSDLVILIGTLGLGDAQSRNQDILGRVYEYFLGKFASLEGKGGEFYTPKCIVKLLVEMTEPYKGIVYDPCCGSGGMFVQSEQFVIAHGGRGSDIRIYGQELNPTTWKLCKMNLAIRGIQGNIGDKNADTFSEDLHPSVKADFIIANPPFNMSEWGFPKLQKDARWEYGLPPANNANFAWLQHMLSHLTSDGLAGFVLSNGSLAANQTGPEGAIRKSLLEADVVDCIVALPSNLFYTTQIAACLWFISKNRNGSSQRNRKGEILFIYASAFGRMVDRIHRELTDKEVSLIAQTYHNWRSKEYQSGYKDIPGFCKSASLTEVAEHNYALVPGRYVGFDRSRSNEWDLSRLRSELVEVENRVAQISTASSSALLLLKELLGG